MNPDVCIHCAATGCVGDMAVHTTACPFTTGLWPVDADMVDRQLDCAACQSPFVVGEFYAEARAVDMFGLDAVLIVCVPCAVIGVAIT